MWSFIFLVITLSGLGWTIYIRNATRITSGSPKPSEVPTVSLLIPARNETHAITNTLHNALSLDYPRLEIIVLDDQSGDNTSEKIRAFAQDGVRFVKGEEAPEGWVGKNWACEQLAQAASGDYLIFCDVDVLLHSKGFNRLIRLLISHKLTSISSLPKLLLMQPLHIFSLPLLHWLLLLLPSRHTSLVPVYGGLMVFEADAYRAHGGYGRYFNVVLPEFKLARDFMRHNNYRFLANSGLRNLVLKKPNSLIGSRIRYLAPLYRSFPSLACVHLLLIATPLIALYLNLWIYAVIASAFSLALWRQVNYSFLLPFALPIICSLELTLLILSFIQHQIGQVTWKQRDVPQTP